MDINQLEIDIKDEINRLRANPASVIPELQEFAKNFKGKYYKIPGTNINIVTNEGAEAVFDAIDWLKTIPACPPLKEARGLYCAARDHANDLGESGKTSHIGSDGSRMNERIERYGDWDHSLAENIAFDDAIARDIVIGMLIDDGNKSRGHRRNMLNPEFKHFGIACARHVKHKWVTIINFAVFFEDFSEAQAKKKATESYRKKTSIIQDGQTRNGAGEASRVTKSGPAGKVSIINDDGTVELEGDVRMSVQEPLAKQTAGVKVQGAAHVQDIPEKRSLSPNSRGGAAYPFDEKLYDFENDPDRPAGAVSVKIKRHIKIKGNRKMIKLTKIYTMQKGEPEIIEIIDFEAI